MRIRNGVTGIIDKIGKTGIYGKNLGWNLNVRKD